MEIEPNGERELKQDASPMREVSESLDNREILSPDAVALERWVSFVEQDSTTETDEYLEQSNTHQSGE